VWHALLARRLVRQVPEILQATGTDGLIPTGVSLVAQHGSGNGTYHMNEVISAIVETDVGSAQQRRAAWRTLQSMDHAELQWAAREILLDRVWDPDTQRAAQLHPRALQIAMVQVLEAVLGVEALLDLFHLPNNWSDTHVALAACEAITRLAVTNHEALLHKGYIYPAIYALKTALAHSSDRELQASAAFALVTLDTPVADEALNWAIGTGGAVVQELIEKVRRLDLDF
jgi:hypothetical protein